MRRPRHRRRRPAGRGRRRAAARSDPQRLLGSRKQVTINAEYAEDAHGNFRTTTFTPVTFVRSMVTDAPLVGPARSADALAEILHNPDGAYPTTNVPSAAVRV